MAEKTDEEILMDSKKPITSDQIVRDIILAHPDAAEVLMRIGMGCISCPAALMESLGDACMVHGLDGEEVCKYLNQELDLPQAEEAKA
ncbi:MAG TPA: disulfide oxidoreductase [Lachnospiraceae bacterium]|jgi:hybrid cluster-associated redox disulfide protein|nr:disulfide oxidoreductase [Lachnospiraceae bacterium]